MSFDSGEFVALKSSQGWEQEDIENVLSSRKRCDLCRLSKDINTGFIKVMPRGPVSPDIMIIGEAPGFEESKKGKAFIGPAASHGESILSSLGIDLDRVRFTNTVRCFPQDGDSHPRPPDLKSESVYCLNYLWDEIDQVRPEVIVTLGAAATKSVLGTSEPISKVAGKVRHLNVRGETYRVVPCFHFSADLRSGGKYAGQIAKSLNTAYSLAVGAGDDLPITTHILNSNEEAIGFFENVLRLHDAGELPYIAYDLEYDVSVSSEMTRSEANRMSTLDVFNDEKKLVAASFAFSDTEGYCIPLDCKGSKVDFDAIAPAFRQVIEKIPVIAHNYLKAEGAWTWNKLGVRPTLYSDTMLESFVLHMKSRSHGLKGLCALELGWKDWSLELDIYLESLPPEMQSFKNVPINILGRYGAIDPVACWILHKKFIKQIDEEDLHRPLKLLNEASEGFLLIETRGAHIDLDLLKNLEEVYPRLLSDHLDELKSFDEVKQLELETGNSYNPNSTQQVADVLFAKFGAKVVEVNPLGGKDHREIEVWQDVRKGDTYLPFLVPKEWEGKSLWLGKESGQINSERIRIDEVKHDSITLKTPLKYDHLKPFHVLTGTPKTSEGTIVDLIKHCRDENVEGGVKPELKRLSDFLYSHRGYKKVSKIINSYITTVPKYLRPGTNKLVFNYILHATDTGRLATRDFSLQTIPWKSDIRRLFVSEWKDQGGLILSMDQSQLEMRVLASETADPDFLGVYLVCTNCQQMGKLEDKNICTNCGGVLGDDLHSITASRAWKKPRSEITPAMRRFSKTLSFGIAYGRGPGSIAMETGLTRDEAKTLIGNFYEGFPQVRSWIQSKHKEYHEHGTVRAANGRKLFMEGYGIKDKPDWMVGRGERGAQNYPIQSSASDLTLSGLLKAQKYLSDNGFKSKVWEFTHDSVETDVYPGELMEVMKVIKESMQFSALEDHPWMKAPLVVDGEIGVRWDGALDLESFDDNTIHLKGKKKFYDETLEVMRKAYNVKEEIIKEFEVEQGEQVVLRKSYEGFSGGTSSIEAKITVSKK